MSKLHIYLYLQIIIYIYNFVFLYSIICLFSNSFDFSFFYFNYSVILEKWDKTGCKTGQKWNLVLRQLNLHSCILYVLSYWAMLWFNLPTFLFFCFLNVLFTLDVTEGDLRNNMTVFIDSNGGGWWWQVSGTGNGTVLGLMEYMTLFRRRSWNGDWR